MGRARRAQHTTLPHVVDSHAAFSTVDNTKKGWLVVLYRYLGVHSNAQISRVDNGACYASGIAHLG